MGLKLITPPASEPITLPEAKAHLNVNFDNDNDKIEAMIKAARSAAEQFTGRAFIDQTWELALDEFPDSEIQIPMPPLIEVVSISYDDSAGDEQVVGVGDYSIDDYSQPGWVVPLTAGWPTPIDAINSVRVRFRAGYLNTDSPPVENVPFDIKAAIKLTLGTLYAHRETIVVGQTPFLLPWAAEQLLRPYRVHLAIA